MLAGHDFDALLMGSLYGELSAVEESRLQAHLAAHPGDQELWRGLLRTREAIRSSAALGVVEPPQAISARILQEAARRAPKAHAIEGGLASRLGKWLATFAAHPALAAAAMAVVAVGVAGTMYVRGQGSATSPTVASPSLAEPLAGSAAAQAATAETAAPAPAAPVVAADPTVSVGDSFAVGLANESASGAPGLQRELRVAEGKADSGAESTNRRRLEQPRAPQAAEEQRPSKASAKPAPKGRDQVGYLDATTADYDLPLKELKDEDRKEASSPADDAPATAPPLVIAGEREVASPRQAKQPAPTSTPSSASTSRAGAPGGAAPSRAPVAAGPAAPAPAPPASEVTRSDTVEDTDASSATMDKLEATERSIDKWAASEHTRLVRLARGNKCTEAAAVARSISERAPRYYADRVTGDKELRACSSAIRDALNLRPDAKRKATRAGEAEVRK